MFIPSTSPIHRETSDEIGDLEAEFAPWYNKYR